VILEAAVMTIIPGQEEQFLQALEQARDTVLAQAPGWQGLTVRRGIERPGCFLLTLQWATLEDHTVTFRGGPLFTAWRALIGPYFAEPPVVEHWAEVP
jgi:heme-degrading monooxygenase HmoA